MRSLRLVLAGLAAAGVTALVAGAAAATVTLPVLWTAGGLDAGSTGAGQAARIAADPAGNVAVVSGTAVFTDLAVTSYTATGALRWRATVTPSIGRFVGDWVATAPNGDVVAVGHNITSSGSPIALTIVRFGSDGTLQWRVDPPGVLPSVARLLVDAAGNSYLALNAVGDGQDIAVQKYSPAGVLLWSRVVSTGFFANDVATSLALSPDETHVVLTGNIVGGATWITAAFDTATGTRRWLVTEADGLSLRDVVVDATRVYVTGQTATGAGTPALAYWLTVIAYDRATGARLWRVNRRAAGSTAGDGRRIALAADGSLVVAGTASFGFLDWYTVALERTGAVRWETVRDGGLNTNEIPAAVVVLADGTIAVTGVGGPNLPGGFIQGVTAGYSPAGTLRWEAFARMATVWATRLPDGGLCATGGYDALVTCWREGAIPPPAPNTPPQASFTTTLVTGFAPLTVGFDGSRSADPDGTVVAWAWSFGDGASATGATATHVYSTPGTYTASLTVTDDEGAASTTTRMIVVSAPLPPEAPAGLTATALGGSSIGLTWANLAVDQTEVWVERCRGTGCTAFAQVARLPGTAASFTDAGLARRTTYRYRVRAHNAAGNSPYSNIASARTTR